MSIEDVARLIIFAIAGFCLTTPLVGRGGCRLPLRSGMGAGSIAGLVVTGALQLLPVWGLVQWTTLVLLAAWGLLILFAWVGALGDCFAADPNPPRP